MTVTDMQNIFEGLFALVVTCNLIGIGIGYIVKLIRSAAEN